MTIFYFITFILAALGIYHIIENIIWQIHVTNNPEDIENMLDYVENKKK